MKSHWLYILVSLSGSAGYGSSIQEDVRTLSGGAVRLWPATLYGSLEELTSKGWLVEVDDADRPDGSGRERYYRLSDAGRDVLRTELARLEGLAGIARARLEGESA